MNPGYVIADGVVRALSQDGVWQVETIPYQDDATLLGYINGSLPHVIVVDECVPSINLGVLLDGLVQKNNLQIITINANNSLLSVVRLNQFKISQFDDLVDYLQMSDL